MINLCSLSSRVFSQS